MVGMAVATTVDSIDARIRLSMMPAVTTRMRLRDMLVNKSNEPKSILTQTPGTDCSGASLYTLYSLQVTNHPKPSSENKCCSQSLLNHQSTLPISARALIQSALPIRKKRKSMHSF